MRLDDFICLGRSVPEESKKYGTKVCMAGLSRELGSLIRVYPLPIQNAIRVRHQCTLDLERNTQDSRKESWKLKDRFDGIGVVSDKPVLNRQTIWSALKPYVVRSIKQLNDERKSLGILEIHSGFKPFFRERYSVPHPDQQLLFEIADECFGANAIDLIPYLSFHDADGYHELQIREWGCYEWLRKERANAAQLWKNLGFDADRQVLALIGNQANRRTSWLIVKTFSVPIEIQQPLFL